MDRLLLECMRQEKIEYYAVLDYNDCEVSSPRIAERMGFSPKSVVVMLLPYFVDVPQNFSVYAASLDYHLAVREITGRIIDRLSESFAQYSYFGFGDHSPIDERRAALSAGLGILGKNRLLINEKYGSYCFIAEIITDAPIALLKAIKPLPVSHCDGCNACISACPTGILRGECDECLSALTQQKGELRADVAELMRKTGTAWGCDECQRACPYNAEPRQTPIDFFHRDRITLLSEELLSGMSDSEFERRAFSWRGRKTVERNLRLLSSENDEK